MIKVDCDYNIKEDIGFILESEKINSTELSERTKVSRVTLDSIDKQGRAREDVCEKIYAYAYENKYRINAVKEELIKEKYRDVLFHGSKYGLSEITISGSRDNCDFGKGFYMGTDPSQPLTLICDEENPVFYAVDFDLTGLKVLTVDINLDWAMLIAYYRGYMEEVKGSKIYEKYENMAKGYDVILGYIANDRMYRVMKSFFEKEITDAPDGTLYDPSCGTCLCG